ncbi:MAG: tRNA 4-thiouridine(8) synthase ThiI, partial [Lachnospiraceae bacterium]|nr:tRNA 4-thiouridine(8) synthase ThiI [Lachnospiraceae bacterium]
MYSSFLIKYAEIGIKGKNRYLFENALVQQIKYACKRCEGEFEVRKAEGRIYVDALTDFDYDETVDNLKTVFGISGICPMIQLEDNDFDVICKTVIDYFDNEYPDKNKTFKVFARRSRKS